MAKHCPVLQVVGYKNSGKTTLVERLAETYTNLGWRVATVKHHGHGGAPTPTRKRTDSERFIRAGVVSSTVEGDGELQLSTAKQTWTLDRILQLQIHMVPDTILVEGWKNADYPKVVLLRGEEDEELLLHLTNVICVLYQGEMPRTSLPVFSLVEDVDKYIPFIMREMEDRRGFKFI